MLNFLRNRSKLSKVLMLCATLGVVGLGTYTYLDGDCCGVGASCCYPGSPCCAGNEHASLD
jgi:hypothetical protein